MKLIMNGQELPSQGWFKFTRLYLVSKLRMRTFGVMEVDALHEKLERAEDIVVVDCRLADVYTNFGHIPGAISLPVTSFEEGGPEISRNGTVVVVCYFGLVCQIVARALVRKGFRDVYILKGGMNSWNMSAKPLEKSAAQHA